MSVHPVPGIEPAHRPAVAAPVALLDAWLAPIHHDAPAGSDTSYHDAQLAIRQELDKLQSLAGQVPSWVVVFSESSRLLCNETKDLCLAGFLMVALFELHGLEGLTLGLRAVAGIAERFWESCWPPRARVKQRTNTLQWAIEQSNLSGRTRLWTRNDLSALPDLERATHSFAQQMQRCVGPTMLDLEPLRALIRHIHAAVPANETEPLGASSHELGDERRESATAIRAPSSSVASREAASDDSRAAATDYASPQQPDVGVSTTAQSSPSATEHRSAPRPPDDRKPTQQDDVIVQVHALAGSIIDLAQDRFDADRSDPRGYRWLRRGLWLPWDHIPTAGARGRTEISPPNRKLYQALHRAACEQRWDVALEQGERLCRHNPFWLEGHLLSANALENLGESYRAAKTSVEFEVWSFVQRLPQLRTLQFSDGSPVCPPAVASWLAGMGWGGDVGRHSQSHAHAGLDDQLRQGLIEDDLEALAILRKRLNTASDARSRFLFSLDLARALQSAGRHERALTLYLSLEQEIEERRLWSWEAECCVQVLRALVTLMSSRSPHGVNAFDDRELRRIRVRLAQLDPTLL